jgi:hypothetical protein
LLQNALYRLGLREMGIDTEGGLIVRLPKEIDDPEFEVRRGPFAGQVGRASTGGDSHLETGQGIRRPAKGQEEMMLFELGLRFAFALVLGLVLGGLRAPLPVVFAFALFGNLAFSLILRIGR